MEVTSSESPAPDQLGGDDDCGPPVFIELTKKPSNTHLPIQQTGFNLDDIPAEP
jgi:hypothetical protein